jgi:hypothetical protein
MNLVIRVYPVGSGLLSESELDQIATWQDAEFSSLPVANQYEWAVGGHYNVLLHVDDHFAGFVSLMKRDVLFDDAPRLIAAVRGVRT